MSLKMIDNYNACLHTGTRAHAWYSMTEVDGWPNHAVNLVVQPVYDLV